VVSARILGLVAVALALAPAAVPAGQPPLELDVNNTGDAPDVTPGDRVCEISVGGPCTLRAAIQETNGTAGTDFINFAIPGTGVKTIAPTTNLPGITDPLQINGYTQTGASPNTKPIGGGDDAVLRIQLSGANNDGSSGFPTALTVNTGGEGTVIRGLVINRFGTAVNMSAQTTVRGNFVGTNPNGKVDRGNTGVGVFGFSGSGSVVGGTTPDARNLISANFVGVGLNPSGNTIQGNYIGTQRDGVSPLGNKFAGVRLTFNNNLVGPGFGDPGSAANVIAFNGEDGIATLANVTQGNHFTRNRIFANGTGDPPDPPNANLGIDLNDDGRTPNDPMDPDTGSNGLQNFPVLSSAIHRPGRTTVKGTLNSFPNAPYGLEFFENPPGGNEGKKFIGRLGPLMTDANGNASFTFKPANPVAVDRTITATATDDGASTSEFSRPRKVKKP
jgi:hypothetical protein